MTRTGWTLSGLMQTTQNIFKILEPVCPLGAALVKACNVFISNYFGLADFDSDGRLVVAAEVDNQFNNRQLQLENLFQDLEVGSSFNSSVFCSVKLLKFGSRN